MVNRSRPPNETNNESTDTDETLMERLRDGNDLALNALMDRWEKPLIGFVSRYTDSRSDALELAQETFVRIYENRGRYRAGGKFSTWMFTIAVNLCRNHARWTKRHPSVANLSEGSDELVERIAADADSPDVGSMRSDEATLVRRAIQELPHDQRTAVLLSEYHGLSHAEIAEVQRCSVKAVEARLYRARKLLRSSLEQFFATKPPASKPKP